MTKAGALPRRARETTVLMPLAMTMEVKLDISKEERRTISWAKKTPAIGALKVAATPPETPQATIVLRRSALIPKNCPVWLPIAPPIWAIGPSCPAEPPVPRVMALAMPRVTMVRSGTLPPPRLTWARKREKPNLRSFLKKIQKGISSRPPTIGKRMARRRPCHSPALSIWRSWLPWITTSQWKKFDELAKGIVAETGEKPDDDGNRRHEGIFADLEAAEEAQRLRLQAQEGSVGTKHLFLYF